MKHMGLDISSSTIGYTICEDENLLVQGHYKPMKSKVKKINKTLAERLLPTYKDMVKLFNQHKPDSVCIEDYARKFSPGRSSAQTIIVLSCFNEVVSMACVDSLGFAPSKYPVASIRKTIGLKGKVEKEDVLKKILEKHPSFNVQHSRSNNIKKETYDEADSLAVIIHHLTEV
jgi:Holliday junction resolvasome RuvABC endonuclease subunit